MYTISEKLIIIERFQLIIHKVLILFLSLSIDKIIDSKRSAAEKFLKKFEGYFDILLFMKIFFELY
jgi:hypothetical protein